MSTTGQTFSFDSHVHEYVDDATGAVLPHITGMLQQAGLVNTQWFKPEHSERGERVHRLCADLDMGVFASADKVTSGDHVQGYLLAYQQARKDLGFAEWEHIEVPFVNWAWYFGGRPDRFGPVMGARSVLDIKSGVQTDAAPIQTALQAILLEPHVGLPAEGIPRYGLYLKKTGKYKLMPHVDPKEIDEARRILVKFAGRAVGAG